jgi:hypothetical protein
MKKAVQPAPEKAREQKTNLNPEEHLINSTPGHEVIAVRAYELWIARGCPIGSPELDWLQAEAELSQAAPAASHVQTAHSNAA